AEHALPRECDRLRLAPVLPWRLERAPERRRPRRPADPAQHRRGGEMVRRHSSAVPRAVAIMCGLLLLTAGCGADDVIAPESAELFLFLVLHWRTLSNYDLETFSQHALLVTAGSPS